ncbi:hypothetical protein [Teredinibacter sp. KSP-S5-2]|uniref:hypothetical protein n=1 Tax=Teredinibacter sp. KSP-S5-2 TaxID=3034506 RepID=UPI0029341CA6|nr:hypothetical protein [Teredinibacter sp. KSP-S5-2]WNO07767.1 hypothetical protein P5V12_12280 [Teredinibacter sp. KSP-S5-2]
MKILFLAIGMFVSINGYACSVALPVIIPPDDAFGEFTYVPPPSENDLAIEAISSGVDVAVVKVSLDWHQEIPPYNALTQVEVLYGWGYQNSKVVKYYRYANSCGKPDVLLEGKWYIAIMDKGIPTRLLLYSEFKDNLAGKGKPTYVYSNIGLLK